MGKHYVKPAAAVLEIVAEGSITADGTEQEVAELSSDSPVKFMGWISLDNMDLGDRVTIKTYAKNQAGVYKTHAVELYADVLEQPMVNLMQKVTEAYKITLQQTAGTYRSYDYRFYKEG